MEGKKDFLLVCEHFDNKFEETHFVSYWSVSWGKVLCLGIYKH